MEILEYYPDIPLEDLKKREIARIAQGYAEGLRLVNSTLGGDGVFGHIPSELTRQRLSKALKGRVNGPTSEETKRRISEAKKGFVPTTEHRAKISAANTGRKHTVESIERMKVSHLGRPATNGMHVRWHVNRNIIKEGCIHCG
jgi:hypothetical protein